MIKYFCDQCRKQLWKDEVKHTINELPILGTHELCKECLSKVREIFREVSSNFRDELYELEYAAAKKSWDTRENKNDEDENVRGTPQTITIATLDGKPQIVTIVATSAHNWERI